MHPFPEGSRPALIAESLNTELERELLAEPLADLVESAMKDGDAIRGAKLFYGEKTACASCHDVREGYQMGPKLTTARTEATPEFLIESILKPSKSIQKGFQSVNVITNDGGALSGYLADETDESITISIATDAGKLREIKKDEVDEVIKLEQSTMPAGLANLCVNRQGFLDLARFVLEINRDGPRRLRQLRRAAKVK